VVRSREIRQKMHVESMGDLKMHNKFERKSKWKRLLGKTPSRWENYTKLDLKGEGGRLD
jgi:hypothetical protein